jgi:hypothetical protein
LFALIIIEFTINSMSRIAFLLLMALFAIVKCQSATNVTTTTTTNSTTTEPTANTTTAVPTTASPTTTSAPAPTLSPTPTLPPNPDKWNGNVTKDNTTCIRVQFAVQIRIKYNNTINNTEEITGFNIPINATVDEHNSFCSSNTSQEEVIVISFVDQEHTSANLTLRFNSTKDNAFVEEIELSYILTEQLFPYFDKSEYNKIVKVVNKTGLSLFSVPADHSYMCDNAVTASLQNEDSSVKTSGAEVDFTNSRVEAFIKQSKNGEFDSGIYLEL